MPPLSSYARTALTAPSVSPTAGGGSASLSSYAQAHLTSPATPDAQAYQSTFANSPIAPTPSFLQKVGNTIAQPFSAVSSFASGFQSGFQNTPTVEKTPDLISGVGKTNALTAIHDAFTQGIDKVSNDMLASIDPNSTNLQANVSAGRAVVDTIGATFGTLLAPFQAYASVPVLGNVLDLVNKTFGGIAEGSAQIGTDQIKTAVQQGLMSQNTADTITPLVHDTAALVGQLAFGKVLDMAGGGIKDKVTQIADNSKQILSHLNNDPAMQEAVTKAIADHQAEVAAQNTPPVKLPVTSDSAETQIKVNTPMTKMSDYANKMGYEPITPDNQLPTIQAGKKAPSSLPTIKADVPATNDLGGGLKLVPDAPVAPETSPVVSAEPQETKTPSIQTDIPKTSTPSPYTNEIKPTRITTPEGTVTKTASDINTALVKQGVDALSPDAQSKYQEGSYKGSVEKVAQMMTDNVESVKEMAKTGEGIPKDVHPQILFNAIEALATKEKNISLLQDLAKSPLGTHLSEAGGTLGSHGFNDNPNSVVKILRRANEVMRGGAKDTANLKESVKSAKVTITKTASRMIEYDKILESITC